MLHLTTNAKAAIFDCDGTLADTLGLHLEAWNLTLSELGYEITEQEHEQHTGKPSAEFIRDIAVERAWGESDWETVGKKKEQAFKALLQEVRGFAPVIEVAKHLAESMPLAVVSGGARENVQLTLKSLGLSELFPIVLTADDDIAPKPSAEIFLEAARRLGVQPEDCIVFEDAPSGFAGAEAAKMRVIDVRPYRDTV